jgi:DNA-binding NarL/FixJ family response regulator
MAAAWLHSYSVRGDPLAQLTARERDVLALMAQGSTDFGISKRVFVTQKTVEFHARNIFRKLDVPVGEEVNRRVHAVLTFLQGAA